MTSYKLANAKGEISVDTGDVREVALGILRKLSKPSNNNDQGLIESIAALAFVKGTLVERAYGRGFNPFVLALLETSMEQLARDAVEQVRQSKKNPV